MTFEDLAVKHQFRQPRELSITWSEFDNTSGMQKPIASESSFRLPRGFAGAADGSFYVARIQDGEDDKKGVSVYLRKEGNSATIVGIERQW